MPLLSVTAKKRVLEVGKDRTREATEKLLGNTFTQEQLKTISAVCVDMWEPYISAIKEKSPQAQIVHDKFYVVKYLNKGIDNTRKKEVKTEPLLKKAKYVMLKNSENLTDKEKAKFI